MTMMAGPRAHQPLRNGLRGLYCVRWRAGFPRGGVFPFAWGPGCGHLEMRLQFVWVGRMGASDPPQEFGKNFAFRSFGLQSGKSSASISNSLGGTTRGVLVGQPLGAKGTWSLEAQVSQCRFLRVGPPV